MRALAMRMQLDNRTHSLHLASQASELADKFLHWQKNPPTDAERNEAYRHATALIAAEKTLAARERDR